MLGPAVHMLVPVAERRKRRSRRGVEGFMFM
jgi:hypothetical protein